MKTIHISEVQPDTRIISFGDTAMYLNLFHHNLVEELLESFNEANDAEIIQEVIDTLELPITCVIEHSKTGDLIHGYINNGGVLV